MRLSLIPLLLLVMPLAEIAAFIFVGSRIGVLATLALIVLTAIAGTILLRVQGFGVLQRIRQTVDRGGVPGRDLVHGVMILIAGILLLVPGFVTDTIGFLLFIPAVRDFGWRFVKDRIVVVSNIRTGGGFRSRDGVVDLDEEDYRDMSGKGRRDERDLDRLRGPDRP